MAPVPQILQRLAYHVGNSSESCQMLAAAANPCQVAQFIEELQNLLQRNEHVPDIFSSFLSWCGNNRTSPILQSAIKQRSTAVSNRDKIHRDIVRGIWLSKDDQRFAQFISSIKVVQVI
jgi:hypothetical protein